nr:conserved hypothetical protein, containing PIN domain [uncultured archaeon]
MAVLMLIDTNVVVSFLIDSEKTAEAKLLLGKTEEPVVALNIVEEIIYVGLSLIYGVSGFKLKEKILKKGISKEANEFFNTLESFLSDYGIEIIPTPNDLKELLRIIRKYRLLPNDALIAATCKHHGIRKIATFDSDFDRVDFLEVITPD